MAPILTHQSTPYISGLKSGVLRRFSDKKIQVKSLGCCRHPERSPLPLQTGPSSSTGPPARSGTRFSGAPGTGIWGQILSKLMRKEEKKIKKIKTMNIYYS
jgi:hypothetical protein